MIGVAIPLARSMRCSSIPLVFGICTSTIRHAASPTWGELKELVGGRESVRPVAEGAQQARRRHANQLVVVDDGDKRGLLQ